jgi:hypothetical protein
LTNPLTLNYFLPLGIVRARELAGRTTLRTRLLRAADDDALTDGAWRAVLASVELFENERWAPGAPAPAVAVADDGAVLAVPPARDAVGGKWAKSSLRPGERVGWTRGRDGWSGLGADGVGVVRSVTRPAPHAFCREHR